MSTLPSRPRRILAALVGSALLAVPLAACDFGSGAPEPVAVVGALKGNTTAIKLDKGFVKALSSLKLTPGVLGTAKLTKGSLVFPITGGNVTVFKPGEVSPYVIGQVHHDGSGLSLSAGGTTVQLTNFNVDPGASLVYGDVALNGKPVVKGADLFSLDGRTLQPLQTKGRTAILQGTRVMISKDAAALLDKVFKTKAVKRGLLVGIARITVSTK